MLRKTNLTTQPVQWKSLTHLLSDRAQRHPQRAAATFIDDDDQDQSLTYAELDRRARNVAAELSKSSSLGERALLLFPPGLDFLVGFVGASYAGLVPTPT